MAQGRGPRCHPIQITPYNQVSLVLLLPNEKSFRNALIDAFGIWYLEAVGFICVFLFTRFLLLRYCSPPYMYYSLGLSHGLVHDVTGRVMTTCDSTCKNNPSDDKEATEMTDMPGGRNPASV